VCLQAIGILCAQKPPANKCNFEHQKPLAIGTPATFHPSVTGGF